MAKKPNILKDIIVNEVSFVKKGANKKKFLLRKADKPSDDNNDNKQPEEKSMKEEILKAATEIELDNTDAIDEAVKKAEISQEGAEAVTTVLQVLKAVAEDLPAEFYPELVTLAGGTLPVTEVEVEKIVEVEVEKQSDEDKAETLKKEALESLPAEQREALEKSLEISKAAEAKADEAMTELKKEQNLRKTEEFVTKADKEFSALPEKAEVIGAMLMKAEVTFEKADFEVFERILKAANDAIASRPDFEATGTIGDGQADSAWAKINVAAEEIRKSNPEISVAKAITQASLDNPELYDEYRNEVN